MEKNKKTTMELNRETALRLWNKCFGKNIKATDFAGREMAKSAYNDRNSKFGWNVDHILPQCKGGVTADHNLEIVNIKTNDEKANKFPGFVANGRNFTIVKVENHYEIKEVIKKSNSENNSNNESDEVEDDFNFLDSAAGVRLYKQYKGTQNKKVWVGTVEIELQNIQNTAIIEFIEDIFSTENISFSQNRSFYNNPNNLIITVISYNLNTTDLIDNLLDKCILLNTYLGYYFMPLSVIKDYSIKYHVDYYQNKDEMLFSRNKIQYRNHNEYGYSYNDKPAKLKINKLVIINSSAKKEFNEQNLNNNELYDYAYIYTKLSKNLKKEVEGNK